MSQTLRDNRTFEFVQDGDHVACNLIAGFVNQQEQTVGFGDTPRMALLELVRTSREAAHAYSFMSANAKSDLNQEMEQYGKSNNL